MRGLPQIDQELRSAVERGDVPGVVAMAASRDGPVYQGAFGSRALPDGAAMTADTVFWIASMTKAVTSTAAMQLVEQGKLSLDRPVAETLPELIAPRVLEGFDSAGEPRLRPARRPITLRHLLTHTAGFGYAIWNPDLARYIEKTGIPDIITCQNAALGLPLIFDPGERWDYGINIDWVGKAVERVSGRKLGQYFAEHIFAPAGMKDTGFELTQERRARLAGMHSRGEDGALAAIPFEMPQEPEFEMGGGALYGTAADYLAFARLFLNEGRAADGRSGAAARDGAADVAEPDRRPRGAAVADRDAGLFERRRVLSRHGQEMGSRLHDLDRGRAGRAQRRQPRLGRSRQHLFLDRPGERHYRRDPDAADPVRRPQGALGFRRL